MEGYYDYEARHSLAKPLALVSFVNHLTRVVANSLASVTGLPLVLVDDLVSHRLGASAHEILSRDGLEAWREAERRELRGAVASRPAAVIALGEGALSSRESRGLVLGNTHLVYLYLSFDEARRRARRQPANHQATLLAELAARREDDDALMALFSERRAGYEMAHETVDAWNRSPTSIGRALGERLAENGRRGTE